MDMRNGSPQIPIKRITIKWLIKVKVWMVNMILCLYLDKPLVYRKIHFWIANQKLRANLLTTILVEKIIKIPTISLKRLKFSKAHFFRLLVKEVDRFLVCKIKQCLLGLVLQNLMEDPYLDNQNKRTLPLSLETKYKNRATHFLVDHLKVVVYLVV